MDAPGVLVLANGAESSSRSCDIQNGLVTLMVGQPAVSNLSFTLTCLLANLIQKCVPLSLKCVCAGSAPD